MKIIQTIILCIFFAGCTPQSTISNVLITAAVHQSSENTVSVNIKNKTGESLHYYLSVEAINTTGNWQEVVIDVNVNPDPRMVKISEIKLGEHLDLQLDMNTILNGISRSFHTFRLKINYGIKLDSLNNHIYTKPFLIKRQYVPDNIIALIEDKGRRHAVIVAAENEKIDSFLSTDEKYAHFRDHELLQRIIINKDIIDSIITYLNTTKCPDDTMGQECNLFATTYEIQWFDYRSFSKNCLYQTAEAKILFTGLKQYMQSVFKDTEYRDLENVMNNYITQCTRELRR